MATMLTTVDNPFDPFTQFDEWYAWDEQAGYHCCSLIARYVHDSSDMTEEEQMIEINNAIDTIVDLNFDGVYRKVTDNNNELDSA